MDIPHEYKLKAKDALISNDIDSFRLILKELNIDLAELSNEEMERLMLHLKANMIYLGVEFQNARNKLRIEKFGYDKKPSKNQKEDGSLPICFTCKWFSSRPPEGNLLPCSSRGAMPEDVICNAFYPSDVEA